MALTLGSQFEGGMGRVRSRTLFIMTRSHCSPLCQVSQGNLDVCEPGDLGVLGAILSKPSERARPGKVDAETHGVHYLERAFRKKGRSSTPQYRARHPGPNCEKQGGG